MGDSMAGFYVHKMVNIDESLKVRLLEDEFKNYLGERDYSHSSVISILYRLRRVFNEFSYLPSIEEIKDKEKYTHSDRYAVRRYYEFLYDLMNKRC